MLNKLTLLIVILISSLIGWSIFGPVLFDNCLVQDDFRQSCFWFWQFWDPELFKNDFYVEMYKSLTVRSPILYLIYKLATVLTDNLLLYTKIFSLLIGILTGISSYFFFKSLVKKINNGYLVNFWALSFCIIINTSIWCTDHITAAHTRSFIWLGLFVYMYLKQESKNISANLFSTFLLLLSPHAFIQCLVMELISYLPNLSSFEKFKSIFKQKYFWITIFNIILTYLLFCVIFKNIQTQGVGTPFSLAEMKALAEFNPGGRHPIFGAKLGNGSWWINEHWGLGIGYLQVSWLIIYSLALLVIFLCLSTIKVFPKLNFQKILWSYPSILFYSSSSLYILAQLVYPSLYHPSRYIAIPWLLLSIIVITLIVGASLQKFIPQKKYTKEIFGAVMMFFAFGFWNYYKDFYHTRFVSMNPQVAQSLASIPKNSLIAGHPLLPDLNTASIISKRSVFADYERAMAYTRESLAEIRRRNLVSLELTYTQNREDFVKLAKANGITHFLAHSIFYSPQYLTNPNYLEPYNQFLHDLINKNSPNFFVKKILDQNHSDYLLIDISKI